MTATWQAPSVATPDHGCLEELRARYTERFPSWSQQFITVFSGKAAGGQRPPWFWTPPIVNWFLTLVQLSVAVLGSVAAVHYLGGFGVLLLPWTWIMTVNALRKLQIVWSHHAIHREVTGYRVVDACVQVISSVVSLTSNYEDFFEDHIRHHHNRKVFTTNADPDVAFLIWLGFRPRTPVGVLRHRLRMAPLSLRFHGIYVLARLKTNFITASWLHRATAALWVATLAGMGFLLPGPEYVLAILVPWFPLYHVAGLYQTITEHQWMASDGPARTKEEYASRCWARFCLEPLPRRGLPIVQAAVAWSVWAARMLVIQAPGRFAVLVSDLPAHDLHHLLPADHRWERAFWHRQMCIDEGDIIGMQNREITLRRSIDIALATISTSPMT